MTYPQGLEIRPYHQTTSHNYKNISPIKYQIPDPEYVDYFFSEHYIKKVAGSPSHNQE